MNSIPTPHISCDDKNKIAKTVLMPGDPLRAKYIADTYLTDVVLVNDVRNNLGYTGFYKDKLVTVMSSGMGMASIGIYSYELFKYYDVENIIRIGSCGAYVADLDVFDVLICKDAYSESSFGHELNGYEDIISSDEKLFDKLVESAKKNNISYKVGRCHSSDIFYRLNDDYLNKVVNEKKCSVVEMEAYALFSNARALNKHAACILTVSDSFVTGKKATSQERVNSFNNMMIIALETVRD